MKSCNKLHLFAFIGILSLFFVPGDASAIDIVNEDFSTQLNNNWVVNNRQGGSVSIIDNSYLHIESLPSVYYPYIYLDGVVIPENNYTIDIRYRFSGNYNYGSGIIFSEDLIPYDTTRLISVNTTVFQIWPTADNKIWVNTSLCEKIATDCIYPKFTQIQSTNLDEWHILRIKFIDDVYKVYLDEGLIFTSSSYPQKIRYIWFGNPEKPNYVLRPKIDIDYFKISTNDENNIHPNIIIPGMGASWDFDALLNGNSGSNWQIPNFVKVYDGLITSLDNTDEYDLNTNLFVFTYDWRKPLDLIADDFNNFVNSLDIGPNEKINLVGHSMGGLVARAYAQKYKANDNINKIYLFGAPNNGTVKAYGTWEGAEIWDDAWWSKTALAIAGHLGTQPSETQIDSIRRMIPSVKDMLPTNNFLYMNGVLLPWSNLIQKNNYLKNLNNDYLSINSMVTNIVSDDVSTKKYINAEPRTLIDELLDKWEDGKPKQVDPFQYAQGDGTVTYEEAKGLFTNNIDGVGGHGDLVTNIENIKSLFRLIGLDETKAVAGSSESIDFENVLIAILKSPGRLELCDKSLSICNEKLGYYFSGYKLFILPNYDLDDLVVRVYEDGLGDYSLHIGYVTNMAKWTVINGLLSGTGQIDYYNLKVSDDNISLLKDETGPTIPSMLGFHDPEVQCGGITSSHNVTVDWSDAEDESGVAGYEYTIDYPNGSSRGVWTTFFQTSQYRGRLNEGIHYIKVRAKDRAGHYSGWSEECSITADWTAPQVSILSPAQGTYLPSKLPELTYLVTDNIDKSPEVTKFGYSKENGDHVVRVVATDEAGNHGEATVNYTVQSPPVQKAQCLSNGWKLFTLSQFKNQGECISFVERNQIARNKYFWWIL